MILTSVVEASDATPPPPHFRDESLVRHYAAQGWQLKGSFIRHTFLLPPLSGMELFANSSLHDRSRPERDRISLLSERKLNMRGLFGVASKCHSRIDDCDGGP